jgi:hypothetical protein
VKRCCICFLQKKKKHLRRPLHSRNWQRRALGCLLIFDLRTRGGTHNLEFYKSVCNPSFPDIRRSDCCYRHLQSLAENIVILSVPGLTSILCSLDKARQRQTLNLHLRSASSILLFTPSCVTAPSTETLVSLAHTARRNRAPGKSPVQAASHILAFLTVLCQKWRLTTAIPLLLTGAESL